MWNLSEYVQIGGTAQARNQPRDVLAIKDVCGNVNHYSEYPR